MEQMDVVGEVVTPAVVDPNESCGVGTSSLVQPSPSVCETPMTVIESMEGELVLHASDMDKKIGNKENRQINGTAVKQVIPEILILDDDDEVDSIETKPCIEISVKSPEAMKPSFEVNATEVQQTTKPQSPGELLEQGKENIQKKLKTMTRKELEDLVLTKCVEAIVSHSQNGDLRTKLSQLYIVKDKLFTKSAGLQKQVSELSRAYKQLQDYTLKMTKGSTRLPPPVKFHRSVGLQVVFDQGKSMTNFNSAKVLPYVSHNSVAGSTGNTQGTKRTHSGAPANVNKPVSSLVKRTGSDAAKRTHMVSVTKNAAVVNGNAKSLRKSSGTFSVDVTTDEASRGVQGCKAAGYTLIGSTPLQVTPPSSSKAQGNVYRNIVPAGPQSTPGSSKGNTGTKPTVLYSVKGRGTNNTPNAISRLPPSIQISKTTPTKFILPPLPNPENGDTRGVNDGPPKTELTLQSQKEGIVLSWTLKTNPRIEIETYQIYACQEPCSGFVQRASHWKKVGDVKALPLPMACTLSQFTDENRYYFTVRAVDIFNKAGAFCEPVSILLSKKV